MKNKPRVVVCIDCGSGLEFKKIVENTYECLGCSRRMDWKQNLVNWAIESGAQTQNTGGFFAKSMKTIRQNDFQNIIKISYEYFIVTSYRNLYNSFNKLFNKIFLDKWIKKQRLLSNEYYNKIIEPSYISDFWFRHYFEGIDFPPQPKSLDFGCGKGQNTAHLLNNGFKVFALDVCSDSYWDFFPDVCFDLVPRGNQKLPYPQDFFDLIHVDGVLGFFTESELENLFSEFFRVLKPKGKCILIESNTNSYALKRMEKYYEKKIETKQTISAIYEKYFSVVSEWHQGFYAKNFYMLKNMLWFAGHDEIGEWVVHDDERNNLLPPEKRGRWVAILQKTS